MFINTLQEDPRYFITVVIAVVLSIVLHELAHGVAAISRGDRTPIETGHMTPNPVVHMGWTSLILLAVVGIAWGAMPVNESRMRGKWAPSIVALAGPASNVVLSLLALTALGLVARSDPMFLLDPIGQWPAVPFTLYIFGLLNLVLAAFNLVPIPPLDGSRVMGNVFPGYSRALQSSGGQALNLVLFVGLFFGARYLFRFGVEAAQWYIGLFA